MYNNNLKLHNNKKLTMNLQVLLTVVNASYSVSYNKVPSLAPRSANSLSTKLVQITSNFMVATKSGWTLLHFLTVDTAQATLCMDFSKVIIKRYVCHPILYLAVLLIIE